MTSRPRLRILCFGDSLTAGYSAWGAIHHPYNEMLENMVSMAYPDLDVATVEDGVSGATVEHGFQTRIKAQFSPPKKVDKEADEKPYDWAIILGGTNDIGMGLPANKIFESLQEVWKVPLSHGCKVLALTVPEAGIVAPAVRQRIDAKRNLLNKLIKSYQHENFYVYDLHAVIPFFSMPLSDRKKYWGDHIHFTADGYDMMGNKIGIYLVSLLAKEKANSPQRPQKRRRLFKDDDKKFEEEVGDPNSINQGYVVVRQADLD
ncbi:hypothetical protein CHGG_06001 [Chaetomium globosum CBS 148.51]|uniref:SGNH hydrolase-type esterase domain-containing protein n=1 Tax=Chaetomium globosum (strain ATCC 6205 / CBS 148.51 / DSM 1962 / NBRC 6347 / NRRL 1970) TaxID=306901 RepID=Q2H5R4_CHAGB|nr:uncharacterized protein CHGG_06001 [Chaetomium globosum CBS 148.51]EAQ89382.1 hypothetical protein CHGG_06001 [Chaetomium globosum CBS 148.51]